jgi:L-asparagine transporter-like permease
MKELTDEELRELADKNLETAYRNLSVNRLILIILVIEVVLFLTNTISTTSYLIFIMPCWLIYMFHYFRYKKSIKVVDEVIKELDNR